MNNLEGKGTQEDPYEICGIEDIRYLKESNGNHYKLMSDIEYKNIEEKDYEEKLDYAIIRFGGVLDGNGHKIIGFNSDSFPYGINSFIKVNVGIVKNLSLEAVSVSRNKNVENSVKKAGCLIEKNHGEIKNCKVSGKVKGKSKIGGIVGLCSGSIVNCSFSGNVVGISSIGGIVGMKKEGVLRDCLVGDSEIVGNDCTGGIVGHNKGEVSDCHFSSSQIKAKKECGGIVGRSNCGRIFECEVKGIHLDVKNVSGGIAGYNSSCLIKNCEVESAKIEGEHVIGGIVGTNYGNVETCNMNGTIKGASIVGGLIGENNGRLNSSYAKGIINPTQDSVDLAGSLVGENTSRGKVRNCHYCGNPDYSLVGEDYGEIETITKVDKEDVEKMDRIILTNKI